ncbi:MAG TPA: phosphoenolpyruvate carboxykinase (GTP) [Planctomycetota bacterium]|nr:phosphoenolpyruvate carboxykinase (GTP) [Planctomycetota bacterium]
MFDNEESVKRSVAEAVAAFQREQMSVNGDSVWVGLHRESLVVIARGAVCPAEQKCARDREARERLERFYSDLFDACKRPLEVRIESIIGRPISRSWLSVEPMSGDHVILFTLGEPACRPECGNVLGMKGAQIMQECHQKVLQSRMDARNYRNLVCLENPALHRFVADVISLCNPSSVFVCADSPEDIAWVRQQAIAAGEERRLEMEGHTYHFDGVQDQGRDREVTKYLVPKSDKLSKALNQIEREDGLAEVRGLLQNSMAGRTMIIRFLCLGPTDSAFSVHCVQCTDSFYVAHSEDLLYRVGYQQFRKLGNSGDFFRFVHSAGVMNENMVSVEAEKKRIYIDYTTDTIYSANTQYAGNTVGLKKLALRLTISKADREGWLAEHMFIMGVNGPNGRKTYLAGAFPSACGKTSTAMLPGETIMGDDIAYFRIINGEFRAVNAEAGIFGIIQNVNPTDDPVIHKVLANPGEVIFSNVLVKDGKPYWLGMDGELPKDGFGFTGPWHEGKKDASGNAIPLAHKNARYAVALRALDNMDPELDNPNGVQLGGIIYGGRDALAYVPVQQAFDWAHGIVAYGASLETETTFATVGKEGVPELNLMSIQDFLSIPFGKYVENNLKFGRDISNPPLVFGVNYFLRNKAGKFVNSVRDKAVWVKWMELRVNDDIAALPAPTGYIPLYADLKRLFSEVLGKDYTRAQYEEQFTIRTVENLEKIDRVLKFFHSDVLDAPRAVFDVLEAQRERLGQARRQLGDYVSPFVLADASTRKPAGDENK